MSNKLLLHACCAPCAEWPLPLLRQEGYEVTLYYYNPNIHPVFEWQRRLDTLIEFGKKKGVEVISDRGYEEQKWRNEAWVGKYDSRCKMCYDIRMDKTARDAKDLGFSFFTTTLLVSIYQDHDAIIDAAQRASVKYDVSFLYRDFRDGFRKGQQMGREDALYSQKYCGCICSLEESKYKEKIYASFSGSEGETKRV